MTAYKRTSRPREGYRVQPTLPKPWGRCGPWQTGLFKKRQAEEVEAWLFEMARSRPEVVDMLVARRFTLETAWVAKLRGTLDALVAGVNDPLLTEAAEAYRAHCADPRAAAGLDQLVRYAEKNARLSWLRGNNVRDVYRKALETRRANSVRRSLYRAVSELLAFHLGPKGREAALAGVPVPGEDDTRVVSRTGGEIRAVLDACVEDQFRWYVLAAITTAIDQGPLARMTPRHIHEKEGLVAVPDTKNPNRPRLLRVADIAFMAFRMTAAGKGLDERLWPWTKDQIRHRWDDTVVAAGLTGFRFKDLRHLLPTLLAEMGVDRRSIQAYLGHAQGSKQTDRYITPSGDVALLNQAAERWGLTKLVMRAG